MLEMIFLPFLGSLARSDFDIGLRQDGCALSFLLESRLPRLPRRILSSRIMNVERPERGVADKADQIPDGHQNEHSSKGSKSPWIAAPPRIDKYSTKIDNC
jgi:hypothetical protein